MKASKGKKKKNKIKTGDFVLTILVIGLVIFGIIMVFSASYYSSISKTGDPYKYLKDDIVWALLGGLLMIFCSRLDYRVYYKLAPHIFIASIVLLGLLFTPLGLNRGGATRWLGVEGFGFTLMPGEVAKICAIIFVSWYLSKDPTRVHSFKRGVVPMLGVAGLYFILIFKQPNLSTALTICMIIVGLIFVAGIHWAYVVGTGAAGVLGVIFLILTDKDGYQMKRLTNFRDPFQDEMGEGWQVVQSLLALGSGGLFGVGLGKSIQKTLYLPEPQNDFILSIIGEELGFVGCMVLIICYVVLIWRCCHIALSAGDMFGMMLASGITIMLSVQVVMNIAVVTASMPPTGITLPFISYGGNALLLFMGSMGIMLNISYRNAR
ncbi:putative lipid II flippase FtsW [bacterium]|nr:putative lipid II flippase FtsW [bacterium]